MTSIGAGGNYREAGEPGGAKNSPAGSLSLSPLLVRLFAGRRAAAGGDRGRIALVSFAAVLNCWATGSAPYGSVRHPELATAIHLDQKLGQLSLS